MHSDDVFLMWLFPNRPLLQIPIYSFMSDKKDIFGIEQKSSTMQDSFIQGYADKQEEGSFYDVNPAPAVRISSIFRRIDFFLAIIIVFCAVVFFTLFRLQVAGGRKYLSMAEENRIRIRRIVPSRGLIYSGSGDILTRNIPSFTLVLSPKDLPEDEILINDMKQKIKNLFTDDWQEIKEVFDGLEHEITNELYVLKEDVDYDKAVALYILSYEWHGVELIQSHKREYVTKDLTSHILGYTGLINREEYEKYNGAYHFNDYIGKTGIEIFYEDVLKGKHGNKKVEVDSLGREVKILDQIDSVPGDDLVLTIDLRLQEKIISVLKEYMREQGVNSSSAVALNPQNGEVLALVSLPSYDNNLFVGGISQAEYSALIENPYKPLFNRSIRGEYPPGSTFKLIVASAGLSEGVVSPSTTVVSTGGISVAGSFFPDWRAGGHGVVSIRRAIADSVNTYFYILGGGYGDTEGLGLNKIVEYALKFNLGSPSGIDLPSESGGLVPTEAWKMEQLGERWYLGDTYHLSIGQGFLLVTPLQMANWTSSFANNGVVYKPHVLKERHEYNRINSNYKIVETSLEMLYGNFISEDNVNIVKDGLRDAVEYGSARLLQELPVSSGAKTGTAQFSKAKEPHGWFTAFAPFDDPKIVLTVLLEESGGSEKASAPARDIFMWYFSQGSAKDESK